MINIIRIEKKLLLITFYKGMGNIFQGGGKYTENAVRDGRKYFVKYFGRSRNTMNNIFLLRMGGIRSY